MAYDCKRAASFITRRYIMQSEAKLFPEYRWYSFTKLVKGSLVNVFLIQCKTLCHAEQVLTASGHNPEHMSVTITHERPE